MTTLLETKQLTIPSTWSKRSAARGLSQADVDAIEAELAAFRQRRDANTRATIAALLPEYEVRAAALRKRLQAARVKLEAAKQGRAGGLLGALSSEQKHDTSKLDNDVTALWREYAPLAADISAMRATWERMHSEAVNAA